MQDGHQPNQGFAVWCSEQILERKKQALQAKEALEQEQVRNTEAEKQAREAERSQAKARRIVEAQRAQQQAALDLQQKTAYFQVSQHFYPRQPVMQ